MYGMAELFTKDKAHNGKATNELKVLENELVPVYETSTGEKVVYGSELHKALQVKTQYKDWSERRLKECDAVENEDFEAAQICAPSGQTKKDHIIKLDTAKEMAMLERNEVGKAVRKYFIRIEKKYNKPKSQAEMLVIYANQFLEQEKRMQEVEERVKEIDAKITTRNEDYYTIAGYASLRGINVDINKANMLGRKAAKLSRQYGYDTAKVQDPRFGTVNSYHVDILKEVFNQV